MNQCTKTLLVTLSALAMMVGCKKDDKKEASKEAPKATKTTDTPAEEKTPEEPKKTPEKPAEKVDALTAIKACWAADASHDEKALANCYDDNSAFSVVDHTPPVAGKGAETALAMAKSHWTAFSDMKVEPQLVLSKGNKIASIFLMSGTNDGEMSMGEMKIPASSKKISVLVAQVVEMSDAGKIVNDRFWIDQATMSAQLGMHPNPRSPKEESAWEAPVWTASSDSEVEKANLALIKSMHESVDKGDVDGYLALVADDVSFRYLADGKALAGKEEYKKGLAMWMTMADHKETVTEVWAAGDWVVSVTDSISTMKQDMPGTKDTKGKEVKSTVLAFHQFADGKLKAHWVVENSMNYAVQLGLMEMGDDMKHGDMKHGDMKHGEKTAEKK